MGKLTNKQQYILACLLCGGYILHVPGTTVMTSRRFTYPEYDDHYVLIGPDRERKCTVDRRTFKRFLSEGVLTKDENAKSEKWLTPAGREALNEEVE